MPSGDRTGPMGQGSMTGRGFGFCNGNDSQGFENGYVGRGRGLGRRYGFGMRNRGLHNLGQWRSWVWPFSTFGAPRKWIPSKEDEINMLKSQSENLKNTQKEIERRLGELEKQD